MPCREKASEKGNKRSGSNRAIPQRQKKAWQGEMLRHVCNTGLQQLGVRNTTRRVDRSQIITSHECQRKEIGWDPVGVGAHSNIISAGK